ncbi:MAG: protein jag [Clostridiales bacterium]|jgi:spoIIIJ-associated protein|nr:protein jag [Clostridiales bacterium]
MDSVEKYGKTVEEAVADALKELSATSDEVEIEVIDPGVKGFLGLVGSKPCKVRVTKKYNPESAARVFLRQVIAAMGLAATFEIEVKEKFMIINISGDGASRLIGKHGQTLESLQYLISLVVNKGNAPFLNILLDCENYRAKRKETLENLARNLAKKAKQTRRNVVLEPMSSNERRIIHAALQGDRSVSTYSEGDEPYRNVVISPKR